jgi:diguanylate cyclase (GGDEF)-like protein/PAS domain S-box-containing protein
VLKAESSERDLADLAALRASEARLAEAERLARLGSWSWSVGDNGVTWSDGVYRIFGIDPAGAPGTFEEYLGLLDADDRERVARDIQLTVETKQPFEHEYRFVHPDGQHRWLWARGEAVVDESGRVVSLVGFCQDVTSWKETDERRLRAQSELARHQAILEGIARGRSVAQTLDALCRDIEDQFEGARCTVLLAEPAERSLRHAAAPSLPAAFQRAIDGLPIAVGMGACGTAAARLETVIVEDMRTDALTAAFTELAEQYRLRSAWSMPLTSAAGDLLGTFALYRTVPHRPDEAEVRSVTVAGNLAAMAIERDRAERALLTAAHVDPVTGLPNRSRFLEAVNAQLKEPGARLAVMFLDLDRFKWINDSLGHPAGDMILVEVARRLRRVLRERDVVARFGGDEFTILVTDATKRILDGVAERVEAEFTEPFRLDGGEFFLSVSAGIALHDGTGPVDAYTLVRDADAAMYSAKEGGRARHAMFDERLRERVVARVTLESELRRAIERDEFILDYQPVQDLVTGRWRGLEALARWDHPTRGVLAPDEFIPQAEETGLIVPLGLLLIDRIAAQTAAWIDAGCGVRVAANISAIQLGDPNITGVIADVLERHSLDPACLLLEVTESTLMERLDTAHSVLTDLSAVGVRVLIDDFGTGYSSIARLDELPVIGVKIDKRFTRELGVDPNAVRILGAIASLARAMDLRVVAEGIESELALTLAGEAGCDFAQGFHLARPFPPSHWPEFFRSS